MKLQFAKKILPSYLRVNAVTLVSPVEIHLYGPSSSSSGWVKCLRIQLIRPGMSNVKSCLPVHSGLGLRRAGWGRRPSHVGTCINRFMNWPCNSNNMADCLWSCLTHWSPGKNILNLTRYSSFTNAIWHHKASLSVFENLIVMKKG